MDEIKPISEDTARELMRILGRIQRREYRHRLMMAAYLRGELSHEEVMNRTFGCGWRERFRRARSCRAKFTFKTNRHDCAKRNGRK